MTDGKLVRDRIPDILRGAGREPEVRTLRGDELVKALYSKLAEETHELQAATGTDRLEELADIFEVVRALADLFGVDMSAVQQAAEWKRLERGGFSRGLWLVGPPR